MSLEFVEALNAILTGTSIGLGIAVLKFRKDLKAANQRLTESAGHVRNLQNTLASTFDREEQLVRQNAELNGIVTKVQNQRLAALRVAADKRMGVKAAKDAEKAAATAKTLSALEAAPLRPRDEVVANIRSSKAAQEQLSSAN